MNSSVLPARIRRGVGVAAVIGAVVTGPIAMGSAAHAAELPGVKYTCSLLDGDFESDDPEDFDVYDFEDPWTVTVRADLPATLKPGETIDEPSFSASITMGADSVEALRDFDITRLHDGGSLHFYTVGARDGAAAVEFDGLPVAVPSSGSLTLRGSGSAEDIQAGRPGTLKVKMGGLVFSAGSKDDGVLVECEPEKGQNLTLTTITVADGAAPSPTTSTSPTKPAPTTSAPTTAVPSTSAPTTSSTSSPATVDPTSTTTTTVTDTVSGPPVQTDALGRGSNAGTLAAGAAGVLTIAAAAGFATRSLRRND